MEEVDEFTTKDMEKRYSSIGIEGKHCRSVVQK